MRSYALATLLAVGLTAIASEAASYNPKDWRLYKARFGKHYADSQEDARRLAYFRETKRKIDEYNAQDPSHNAVLDHLADKSPEELARMRGFRPSLRSSEKLQQDAKETAEFLRELRLKNPGPVPERIDWREFPGRVGLAKNQGDCGACWAFAATGVLEGQELPHNVSKYLDLSEQELVDCSKSNAGCDGGEMSAAFDDIVKLGGVDDWDYYEWMGLQGKCKIDRNHIVITDAGSIVLTNITEIELAEVVAKYGPVAIAFDADHLIPFYGGVWRDKKCAKNDPDHGVVLVGYDTNTKDGDYWIVKNSWGPYFGDNGFFLMERGSNTCGLLEYPTIAKF